MERFDEYVERCLYDPVAGFYSAGIGSAGRRDGDFITSPEMGPLFGAVLANYIDTCWADLGYPKELIVVDAGAGPGTLCRTIERAEPKCSDVLKLMSADRSSGIVLPENLEGTIVLANELLDNIAFRVVQAKGGKWLDVYVNPDGSETLSNDGVEFGFTAVDGTRAPLLSQASKWVEGVLAAGAERLLVFDYGSPTTQELAERGGWLRTYRSHQRGDDPYLEPGRWDITTDIAVDQFPAPTLVTTQAEFLRANGIDALVEQGRSYWSENAAKPDLEAFLMRSRLSESAALLDSEGLGGWLSLEWSQPGAPI